MRLHELIISLAVVIAVTCGQNYTTSGDFCGLHWEYNNNKCVLNITGSGNMYCNSMTPPWSHLKDSIQAVVIGEDVKSIGEYMFEGCGKLKSLNIPKDVERIGEHAFSNCSSLENVTFFTKNLNHCSGAFSYCSNLKQFIIGEGCENLKTIDGVLFNNRKDNLLAFPCGKTENYATPKVTNYIDGRAFEGCSKLKSLNISKNVERIGEHAFSNCSNLENVTFFTENLNHCSGAFSYCSNLKQFIIGESFKNLQTIDGVLFNNENQLLAFPCGKADKYTIPNNTNSIDGHAFEGCSNLQSISIPSTVKSILSDAFRGCSSLTSIKLPEGVGNIESNVFYLCSSLQSMSLPSTVKSIHDHAFYGCSSITSIEIPQQLQNIDSYSFYGCRSLTSILIPDNVTSIKGNAFEGCSSLVNVSLPSNIKEIGDFAFANCTNLTHIIFRGKNDINCTKDAFESCNASVCVPFDYNSSSLCNWTFPLPSPFDGNNPCFDSFICNGRNESFTYNIVKAIEWESQSDECFDFICDPSSGYIKRNKCRSSSETRKVCVDGKCVSEKALQDEEDKGDIIVEIEVEGLIAANTTMDEIMVSIVKETNIGRDIKIGTEINEYGQIISIFVFVKDDTTAQTLVSAINKCLET